MRTLLETTNPFLELSPVSTPLSILLESFSLIAQNITTLQEQLPHLGHLHSLTLTQPTHQDQTHAHEQLQRHTESINAQIVLVTNALKEHKSELPQSDLERIRKTQYPALLARLKATIRNYMEMENENCGLQKQRTQRQYRIIYPEATDEEVNQWNTEVPIFSHAIGGARQALDAALEEKEELHRLEKNVVELGRMYSNLALLVNQQGELVDQIEIYVDNVGTDVTNAVKELKTAVLYTKKARKVTFNASCPSSAHDLYFPSFSEKMVYILARVDLIADCGDYLVYLP